MAKLAGKRYADALFEIAEEEQCMDVFLKEAEEVLQVLRENDGLSRLMIHSNIRKEEKLEIMENIFKGRVSDEIFALLCILTEKGGFRELESVFEYFIAAVKEAKRIGRAYVTSAAELSDEQKKKLVEKLIQTTKYVEFEMHYDVDTALIGGMVIRIGDRVIDSSIRTKLCELSKELSKIQLKAGEIRS